MAKTIRARQKTRDELLSETLHAHQRTQALLLFVKSLAPKPGWYFVESKRGYSAFLIQVTYEGDVIHYDCAIGSEEWRNLSNTLYRHAVEAVEGGPTPGSALENYLAADTLARQWRSRHIPSAIATDRAEK